MRTVLNTKGIGLSERPDLLRHVDVLVLSLDALDPAKLAVLWNCAEETAHRVLGAVEYAVAERRNHQSLIVLGAVATPDNLPDLEEVLGFAHRRGLAFQVSPEIVGTTPNPRLRQNPSYAALIERIRQRRPQARRVLGVDAYFRGIRDFSSFRCHPLLMPVIRPDGTLAYPCLEKPAGYISVLQSGGYKEALRTGQRAHGRVPSCRDRCQIFCHMGLSLLQRHPLQALGEGRRWAAMTTEPRFAPEGDSL